jgi:hypothetical protein
MTEQLVRGDVQKTAPKAINLKIPNQADLKAVSIKTEKM